MASVRSLKKNLHYAFGDIIDLALIWEAYNAEGENEKSQKIIDESIAAFDEFIARINESGVENKKAHFSAISKDMETKAIDLVEQLNKLK